MDFQLLVDSFLVAQADALAVCIFGDPTKDATFKQLDSVLGGLLSECAKAESFEGKVLQVLTVHSGGKLAAKRVILVGGGNKADFSLPNLRDLVACAVSTAARSQASKLGLLLPSFGAAKEAKAVQRVSEGALMGTYKFNKYLSSDDAKKPCSVKTVLVATELKGKKPTAAQQKAFTAAIHRGTVFARAVNHARDLINEPADAIYPASLASRAEAIVKKHKSLSITVLDAKACEKLGMGMFLAVGKGSEREARLIHMVYKPAKKAKKKIALIGKGVTFDSGGYSLKPSNSMEDMKVDMSGAAAVISAMDAIAELGSDHEIHAIAACCENLVSGRAYKLGDVLKSMDGTTVEINNTDAEGRLTLGDAITYARTKVQPDEMFDFATLTGACMVALGNYTAGVMSDHEALLKGWMAAAEVSGEDMWRLPLNPRLKEQLKSPIADMRNTGDRFGGAITAGLFLKVFAKQTPWVHVDIAGPASLSSSKPSQPKGGTGFAVTTILEYCAH